MKKISWLEDDGVIAIILRLVMFFFLGIILIGVAGVLMFNHAQTLTQEAQARAKMLDFTIEEPRNNKGVLSLKIYNKNVKHLQSVALTCSSTMNNGVIFQTFNNIDISIESQKTKEVSLKELNIIQATQTVASLDGFSNIQSLNPQISTQYIDDMTCTISDASFKS